MLKTNYRWTFGEEINNLGISSNEWWRNSPMMIVLIVFGAFMEGFIIRNVDSSLVAKEGYG